MPSPTPARTPAPKAPKPPSPRTGLLLTGGGAKSPFWSQMIADILGCNVVVPEGSQFGARGAALIAATAAGCFPGIRQASLAVAGGGTTYHPRQDSEVTYGEAWARYRNLRDRLTGAAAGKPGQERA